jgi:type IV secretory pathway VirB9-like protein
MKTITRHTAAVLAFILAGGVVYAQQIASKRQPARPSSRTATPPASTRAEVSAAKTVLYSQRDIVPVNTQLRYTTLLILPKDEVILDFICGDKDLWAIEGEQNFAYVKPSTEKSKTNLNLLTASGNVYSFLLNEVTGTAGVAPDLKVYVEVKDPGMLEAVVSPKRLVSAKELAEAQAATERAKAETQKVRDRTREAIDSGISEFVTNVRFAYRFEAGKKPFNVRAMYHDDRFTYIRARPEETPTLYELKDGRPNLVSFDYTERDVYVIPKILDEGYLAIGRKRLVFKREE